MISTTVKIESVLDAKKFVNICNSVDFQVDLVSGRYVVDAKSLMGLFSLDLTKPMEMHAECGADDEFLTKIGSYIVP